jgi:hypothetical protein
MCGPLAGEAEHRHGKTPFERVFQVFVTLTLLEGERRS